MLLEPRPALPLPFVWGWGEGGGDPAIHRERRCSDTFRAGRQGIPPTSPNADEVTSAPSAPSQFHSSPELKQKPATECTGILENVLITFNMKPALGDSIYMFNPFPAPGRSLQQWLGHHNTMLFTATRTSLAFRYIYMLLAIKRSVRERGRIKGTQDLLC